MSGFLFSGTGGFRTHVLTRNQKAFYMFILFYFREKAGKKQPNPILIFIKFRIITEDINQLSWS